MDIRRGGRNCFPDDSDDNLLPPRTAPDDQFKRNSGSDRQTVGQDCQRENHVGGRRIHGAILLRAGNHDGRFLQTTGSPTYDDRSAGYAGIPKRSVRSDSCHPLRRLWLPVVRARTLLVVCLLLGVASQLAYIFYSTVGEARVVESFYGFGYTLADLAMMHLAVRATPAGSEGLGFSIMISVRNLSLFGSDWIGSKALEAYHLHYSTLVITNGLVSLIAVPLIFLLPAFMVDVKDADPTPPTPVHGLAEALPE